MESKKYMSFFSGAGGLDIGLDKAGWECLSMNEIEPKFAKTLELNHKKTKVYNCDIRDLKAKELMKSHSIKKGELYAVVGGPPCQAFSTLGKRLGLNDDRGNVFLYFLELAMKLDPKYIIIENVRGLLSAPMEHIPHKDRTNSHGDLDLHKKGGVIKYITKILKDKGYKVNFNLYDFSYYGVPQKRERVIMIATKGKIVPDIKPTHKNKPKTVRDAIKNIKSTEWGKFTPKRLVYFKKLKEGQNWKNLSEKDQKEAMGGSYYSDGGRTGFFRRLAWDKPSPTLLTSPTGFAASLGHPVEDRPLSIEEYKAIQTFPVKYKLHGSITDKYKQIGNAIPSLFGKVLAKHLKRHDDGKTESLFNLKLSRYNKTSYFDLIEND